MNNQLSTHQVLLQRTRLWTEWKLISYNYTFSNDPGKIRLYKHYLYALLSNKKKIHAILKPTAIICWLNYAPSLFRLLGKEVGYGKVMLKIGSES